MKFARADFPVPYGPGERPGPGRLRRMQRAGAIRNSALAAPAVTR